MENTAKNPVEELKKQLYSKKMLVIAIVFSVQVILALIDKIQNKIDLVQPITLIEQLFGMNLTEIKNMLGGINTAMFVVSLFSLIPIAATALAFWLIYTGASNEKNKKMISTGFLIFKIYIIVAIAWMVLCLLATLIGCFMLWKILSGADVGSAAFIIPFAIFLVAGGIIAFFQQYFFRIKNMLFGITNTLKTGRNLYYVYTYVIFFQILGIISSVFGAFSSFSAFLNAGVSILISVLYLNMMFSYKNAVGLPDKNEMKTVLEEYSKNRKLPDPVPGYVPDFSVNTTDATTGVRTDVKTDATTGVRTETTVPPVGTGYQKPVENSQEAERTVSSPAPRKEPAASVYEPFEVHVIDVFSEQENANSRFVRLGVLELPEKQTSPVKLVRSEVYMDQLTERRILRLFAKNDSGADVSGLVLSVLPYGNENNVLGSMEQVCFEKGNTPGRTEFLSNYGIILPDGTTFGKVRMKKIFFADGLYWDKGGEELKFVTEEKIDFDMKLYLSLNND